MWYGNLTYVGVTAHNVIVFMGTFVCIAVALRMVKHGFCIPNLLSRSCFFIYVMHTLLILSYVKLFWNMLIPGNNPLIHIVRYIAIPITTVCLIVGMYYCSEKLFPKLTSVLSGGRG